MSVADYFESLDYGPAPEADAHVRKWLESHQSTFGHFIDGVFSPSADGAKFYTLEPATGDTLATIAQGNAADIDLAVMAAEKAQTSWQALGGRRRARHLYALARMVQRHARLFAVLEALDNGKPIRETRDLDIPLVARHFYHHAGWAELQDTELADQQPIGVVGQIIPWNFPLLMLAWKVAPALAFGNTVVLKPAESTPLTALLFAELSARAGLPNGVLNVVTGDGSTGAALVAHDGVGKIAFTGSTEVGRTIRAQTAGSGKSLTLELGGKSPFIVFDDADIDSAIEGVVDAIWFNQGQVCCAGSRLLVHEGIHDHFIARLKERMNALRVGHPLDKAIDMGAIIEQAQLDRIRNLVDKGVEEGAVAYAPALAMPDEGCYYPPTLLTGVEPASTVATEEIFGPVMVAMSFRTPDEAIALANNTRYGLAASVWSENISLALDIAPQLKAGVVWVNATNLFDAGVGFGGYRESGYGREGGIEGAYEYLKPKAWASRKPRQPEAPMPVVESTESFAPMAVDRTAKLYIGGKQVRPDGNYVLPVISPGGDVIGEMSEGNRKDIRNAVEAAHKASGWAASSTHLRAQILYYLGENLSVRALEFAARLSAITGSTAEEAQSEVEASVDRLFTYAAWADKFDGAVHSPPLRGVALAMNEPIGVAGVICPHEAPLLAFVSLVAPLVAMGNRVVAVPSERYGLIASDFYQVLETSDVPGGVVNIVTGRSRELAATLANHDGVDSVWAFGDAAISELVEARSVGNMKRTFVDNGFATDWYDPDVAAGRHFLRNAVQVKNIWIPYGE
ncbi:MAG: aldehyde dehydrogenase family protein [Pseudomonadota bacterium]